MSDPTKYNHIGRMMTGFDSGIEQSMFGYWRNPEYSEMRQSEEQYIPAPGTCQCCGEQFDDDFWSDGAKNLCLNCYVEPSDSGGELPF